MAHFYQYVSIGLKNYFIEATSANGVCVLKSVFFYSEHYFNAKDCWNMFFVLYNISFRITDFVYSKK